MEYESSHGDYYSTPQYTHMSDAEVQHLSQYGVVVFPTPPLDDAAAYAPSEYQLRLTHDGYKFATDGNLVRLGNKADIGEACWVGFNTFMISPVVWRLHPAAQNKSLGELQSPDVTGAFGAAVMAPPPAESNDQSHAPSSPERQHHRVIQWLACQRAGARSPAASESSDHPSS